MTMIQVLNGNAKSVPLKSCSIQCVVTSPPYFGMRDYGTGVWKGGDAECDHAIDNTQAQLTSTLGGSKRNVSNALAGYKNTCGKCGAIRIDAQLGLGQTPEAYITSMVAVFREVKRVLRDDGILWLNLGSSYASGDIRSIQSRSASRVLACDIDDKELSNCPALDCVYSYLCDEHRVDFLNHLRRNSDNNQHSRQSHAPLSMKVHDSEHLDLDGASLVASVLCAQASTILESWLQLPVECFRCASCVSGLQEFRSYAGDILGFAHKSDVLSNGVGYSYNNVLPDDQQRLRNLYTSKLSQVCYSCNHLRDNVQPHYTTWKPKDLVNIPFLIAEALRADGWYLRSAFPWFKPNAMPEPTKDRPNVAHEYWFLFTKSKKYYYDHISILVEYQTLLNRWGGSELIPDGNSAWSENTEQQSYRHRDFRPQDSGRNFRTYDTFFGGLDTQIEETENYLNYLKKIRKNGGLLLSPGGDPLAAIFNTASYKGPHYATFPPKMIVPFIKASTSEYGCCDKCKTPYKRVLSREKHNERDSESDRETSIAHTGRTDGKTDGPGGKLDKVKTIGWKQQCACRNAGITQSIILDPFGGSGTVALVAKQLSISAISIDLNLEYCQQAVARLNGSVQIVEKKKNGGQMSLLDILK